MLHLSGIHGFITKNSKPSLIMGLAIGGLYGGSVLLSEYNMESYGYALGTLTSAALAARMGDYVIK